MENIVIKLVVDGDTKEAVDSLNNLTQKEEEVKKKFTAIGKEAKDAGDKGKKAGEDIAKGANKAKQEVGGLEKAMKAAGAAMIGMFSIQLIKDFTMQMVNTRAEFEKFEAVLTNTLGSSNAAELAMKQIQTIAAKTPFSVAELTASYVKLVNQGFKPTSKEIIKLGDLAASQGKSFDQLTEAIIDAQTGEFERLKEFGIRASKEGDKVTFTFKEQKTQVDFTNDSIRNYILSLGDLEGVTGGMAAISKTLNGQISNLGDSWDNLMNEMGKSNSGIIKGTISLLSDMVGSLGQEAKELNDLERLFGMSNQSMREIYSPLINQLSDFRQNISENKKGVEDYDKAIKKLQDEKSKLSGNVGKVRRETIIYNDAIVKLIQDKKDYLLELDKEKQKAEEARLAEEAKRLELEKQKGAYARLSEAISKYNKSILDSLVEGQLFEQKSNVRQLAELERRKKKAEDDLAFLRRLIEMEANPINKKMDSARQTDTLTKYYDMRKTMDQKYEEGKKKEFEKNLKEQEKANDEAIKRGEERIKKYYEKISELEKKHRDIMLESLNLTQTLTNIYFEQNLALIQREKEERLKVLDEEAAKRLEKGDLTNKKRIELEKAYEQERKEIMRQAFEEEKRYKKQQAIINGALAITQILATTPDPTGIYTALRIAGAVATTASQVALIDAQKFEKGGWVGGKRHRDGGTLIEAEKDEFVVNRNDAQKNKELLDSINKGMADKFILEKYVRPAIIKNSINEINQRGLAENIANSLKYQMYDDHGLKKVFRQSSMQSAQYIVDGLKQINRPSRYV